MDYQLEAYNFSLPTNLIATNPIYPKEHAKLLVYHNNRITHTTFENLFDFIPKDYLIVLNNTKVLKARLFGYKLSLQSDLVYLQATTHIQQILDSFQSQRKKEIFYHKTLQSSLHLVQIKGRVKIADIFILEGINNIAMQIVGIQENGFKEVIFYSFKDLQILWQLVQNTLEKKNGAYYQAKSQHCCNQDSLFNNHVLHENDVLEILQKYGSVPLPPYIKRKSNIQDEIDYQSIFALHYGSVAAPTASLHFSETMLDYLMSHYSVAFVTLHVGAGTFQPVQTENIIAHKIHSESCYIPHESAKKILESKKILCVGTTAMRSVEWFLQTRQTSGENNIFLHPMNPPQKVKSLLTNFHLPKSSLLMLVSSIIGREKTLEIYEEAIKQQYRFYSYGDGMLIIE
ncbi:tRNA preQ1(34) S-adenosylmethionine ribosyltransferase-isomerase QueA [Helicobacter didelphidarum]|uniref:S-adenosylmethionine:tRNA ribosyltransferase-isomerase n=2 Tax=Helicobacter didelphidarum TaxID=2040648 RepID=A0A3D8IHJ4_9HELI|nr:tRNA preQ1(34) S-adenosylmethionine ribosyltransferase-isomerase QueA [Helicobacter didelphidarum]